MFSHIMLISFKEQFLKNILVKNKNKALRLHGLLVGYKMSPLFENALSQFFQTS